MSQQPKDKKIDISFIVPCYCCSEYLPKLINSIYNQKIPENIDFELILIDDHSNDNNKTKKCISKIANEHNNIKPIFLNENIGQAAARNHGLKIANNTYIGFADADDTFSDSYFETLTKFLEFNSSPDVIVWGAKEQHYKGAEIVSTRSILPKKGYIEGNKEIVSTMVSLEKLTLLGYLWNKLYKKKIIKQNKLSIPDEHLIEDILFNINYFKWVNNVLCIDKALYIYNRRTTDEKSVTSEFLPDYFDQHYKRVESFINFLKENDSYDSTSKEILANIYIRYSLSAIWRNTNTLSKMNKYKQIEWIKNYFKLPLSKELIKYANPKGKLAKINSFLFKNEYIHLIYSVSQIVNSIENKSIFIKARQSR